MKSGSSREHPESSERECKQTNSRSDINRYIEQRQDFKDAFNAIWKLVDGEYGDSRNNGNSYS